MKMWHVLAISVAAGVSLPALAQMAEATQSRTDVEARVRDRLAQFDANKDGTVSSDEMRAFAEARQKAHAAEEFAAMDTDKNGVLSRAEFDAGHSRPKGDRMARADRMGGPGAEGAPAEAGGPKPERYGRMMKMERRGGMMAMGDGKGIVIADAVKKALDRFDAADANKDGKLSPDERRAARDNWRGKTGA